VVHQNRLAVKQSKSGRLPRVIWLPEGTRSDQVAQQAFIEALHNDAETQFGADLITGDLETLKSSVHAALKKLKKPESRRSVDVAAGGPRAKSVYLICNEKDRKATVPVRKFLREHAFEVLLPAFVGDAAAVREAHQQLINSCDAVMLFYGAGDEAWKRTVDNDLKKMPGYRGGKPLLGSYTYLADPMTTDKEDLIDMGEPNVINGFDDFSAANMAAFVGALELSGATT
jgi:hypothetical protein